MVSKTRYPHLSQVISPLDIRSRSVDELSVLASEMRDFLIDTLDRCGGHFAGSLGTVELALAIHYCFDTPHDPVIWDVGHQAYPHKMLTGRADQLETIRSEQGLAPFPSRLESPFDAFGTGHSSTSISAALGFALGNPEQYPVAVIGDGGLTGGMAFEALNHAGVAKPNLLIVLNDNEMSISDNVGAMTHYFQRLLSSPIYAHIRESSKRWLKKVPSLSELAKSTETRLKGMITPGALFEELGCHYHGPVDGHDLNELIDQLRRVQKQPGVQLLHVITKKGKGYAKAEADPIAFHAVKPGFHSASSPQPPQQSPSYSDVFGQWLCHRASADAKLMAITPAMCEGSGMRRFAQQYPKQFIDVGIAEQHCVTLAAGLSMTGHKPVVAIYSSFLQRAYDQLIHDVALQNADVTFAVDRAGLVGGDGATHQGAFDLAYLRCIPNLVIFSPSNAQECVECLNAAYHYAGPAVVRYPRGGADGADRLTFSNRALPIGKANYARLGQRIAILAFGPVLSQALLVAEELDATVVNMLSVKPLDLPLIFECSQQYELLVTCEEHATAGGAGSAVAQCMLEHDLPCRLLTIGLPDQFIEHGSAEYQRQQCGLTAEYIHECIKMKCERIRHIETTQ